MFHFLDCMIHSSQLVQFGLNTDVANAAATGSTTQFVEALERRKIKVWKRKEMIKWKEKKRRMINNIKCCSYIIIEQIINKNNIFFCVEQSYYKLLDKDLCDKKRKIIIIIIMIDNNYDSLRFTEI